MDIMDSVKDGIVRAGREAARVRFIGEAQARLVTLRLLRRGRRDAVVDEALRLYRRNAIGQPSLVPLCRELDDIDNEIDRLEAGMARARGGAPSRPSSPVVTELDHPRRPEPR